MSLKCNRCTKESTCRYRDKMVEAQQMVDGINSKLQAEGMDYDILHASTICHQYTSVSLEDFDKTLNEIYDAFGLELPKEG